jgi:hypothetical protein
LNLMVDKRMKTLTGIAMALATPLALAHEGHGQALPHWHATDALGFVALAVVIAAALWASRRK